MITQFKSFFSYRRFKQWRGIGTISRFDIRENLTTTGNEIGSYSEVEHSFSQSDVQAFADLVLITFSY